MSTVGDARQTMLATQQAQYAAATSGGGVGGGQGEMAAGIGPADIWRVIKQRKLLIIVVFVVLYALVVGGYFVMLRYFPKYTSEAFVRLSPLDQEGLVDLGEGRLTKDEVQLQLATAAQGVQSPVVLQEVLSLPRIKETEYYKENEGDTDIAKCLDQFEDDLNAVPARDTYFIRVAMATKKKSEATLIVNEVVRVFIERHKSRSQDEGRQRLDTLEKAREEIAEQRGHVLNQMEVTRTQARMSALESERDVGRNQLEILNTTLAELDLRKADVGAQLAALRGVDPRQLPLTEEMRVMIEADPILRFYRNQVEQLDIQIESMKESTLGPNHRQMKFLQAQRDQYFAKETSRREELKQDYRARQAEMLNTEFARVDSMLIEAQEKLATAEAELRDVDAAIQSIEKLQREEERLADELDRVSAQIRDVQSQLEVKGDIADLSIAQRAKDAVKPSSPDLRIWLGGGFVLAALSAVGLAFVREFTDKAIRTPIDVTRYGHLSVLGSVPLLDDEEADIDDIEEATRKEPQSLVAEAFRQVRAHLSFSGPIESQRTLLITSPSPEDGKSSTAVNLAVTFAQANERTLLIDCNFRRPAIRDAFQHTRSDGLSNLLVGQGTLDDFVTHSEVTNLDVLSSGPMPPNPAELLGSVLMREVLAQAKQKYDRVLIDGPPCLLISDALVVATQVDAVVVVARAVQGTKGTLRRAREQLGRINARVIGAVLNGVEARPGGYFREQYREFYEYMDEEVVVHELPASASVSDARRSDATDEQDKPPTA